ELGLWRKRLPGLPWLPQRPDLVLVAVDVARLDAHDERDGLTVVGLRGGHVRGRVRRVVGLVAGLALVARLVDVGVGRTLVALRVARALLAGPRLELRTREDRAADRVVGEGQARAAP